MRALRIPLATYRLQFNPGFGFSEAKAIAPYLHELGITDLYASPIFQARQGSLHGYDVVDPNRLNPDLGTAEDFDSLIEELHRLEMGWLQDVVPNHMVFDGQNRMLMDVLEKGQGSPFFAYFDIDWDHPYGSLRGKVLAPFLGEFYGKCLESGEIRLGYDETGLGVHYYQLRLPLHIESYGQVLDHDLRALRRRLGSRHADFIKLLGALYVLKNLPPIEEVRERTDQILFVKSMLWELYNTDPEIHEFIDANVARFNGEPGRPESFNLLDQLLSEQLFRLSFWKVATEEINYRRFFNINELISLRMEDEKAFDELHRLIFGLVEEGKFTGLRVDHVDGLYDPAGYFRRIRDKAGDLYLCVEKILALDETLPASWPVQGTTGYDFANYVNGIFCDKKSEARFASLYARFAEMRTPYPDLLSDKKRLMIGKHMAGDVDGLALLMKKISSRDRFGSDITLYGLKRALVEVLTFFPVYRSYGNREGLGEEDRARIKEALAKSREVNPGLLYELGFIERFLLLEFGEHISEEEKQQRVHFLMRFQQLTGPLMAKGFEDTTLYIYNRLLSLNEVGGDPSRFGIAVEEFHEFNQRRLRSWPHSMSATATHDTKRGEDMRARINVLSEIPEEWEKNIHKWSRINQPKKSIVRGRQVPDRNDEYFLYQTLIGAYPLGDGSPSDLLQRLKNYLIKAVREAKVHTAWVQPDFSYEEAYLAFLQSILEPTESNPFLADFVPFAKKVAYYGMLNSLSQTLLKILSPGVPDFYQGTELWDLSFVDPDNRRPVDYKRRIEALRGLKRREKEQPASLIQELLGHWVDGRVKLYLTFKALHFRQTQRALFQEGEYLPLYPAGGMKEHLCAFARRRGNSWAVVAAPRLLAKRVPPGELPLGEKVWGTSALRLPRGAPQRWLNILTNKELEGPLTPAKPDLSLAGLFQSFPLALLAPSE